jgi:hypothetical protein
MIASTLITALVLIIGLSAGLKKNHNNVPNNYIEHQDNTDEDIVEFRRRIRENPPEHSIGRKRRTRKKIRKTKKNLKRSKRSKISKRSRRNRTIKRRNYSKRIQSGGDGNDINKVISKYPPVYKFTGEETKGDLVSFFYGGDLGRDHALLNQPLKKEHGYPFHVPSGTEKGDMMIWDAWRPNPGYEFVNEGPGARPFQTSDLSVYEIDNEDSNY